METNINFDSVVKVITHDGSGSGFFFRRPNYVMTNFHVVEGHHTVTLELQNEERCRATVLLVSQHLDLAVLQVDANFADVKPAEFCEGDTLALGKSAGKDVLTVKVSSPDTNEETEKQ